MPAVLISAIDNKDEVDTSNNNKNQKVCASSCGVNQAYVERVKRQFVDSTQVNANPYYPIHINFKMDVGKWLRWLFIRCVAWPKFADNGTLIKQKAENKWKAINEQLLDKRSRIWEVRCLMKLQKLTKADNDLENQYELEHHKTR